MQLLELTSNQQTFKPVVFKPTGLSLIIGQKSEGSGIKDTYNGVGKSLLIELINFCLGSSKKKSFEDSLAGWEFTLKFQINGKKYSATRSTLNQNNILLNGRLINLKSYTDFLGKELFFIEDKISNLTFRSLVKYFIRSGKKGYSSYKGEDRNPYTTNLWMSYLLGLDFNKALTKHEIKKSIDQLVKSKKLFEENEALKLYSDEVDIDLADLDSRIKELKNNISNFEVADDFHKVRSEADTVANEVKKLSNKEFSIKHALENIENSLKIEPDIDKQQVLDLYNSANIEIPESVKSKLNDTVEFHSSLIRTRTVRLNKERKKLQDQLKIIKDQRKTLSSKETDLLKYLSSKGALEEFTALNMKLNDLIQQRDKLTQYSNFLERFDQDKAEYKTRLASESLKTERYLNSQSGRNIRDENLKLFQQIAKEFYRDKPSGISIHNNDGENQIRYDINVKIHQDQSDGINEVKIFCFDWLLLLGKHNHRMSALVHDSRLFSNMDPRQQSTALRIASEFSSKNNCQYIATLNANMLDGIQKELAIYDQSDVFQEINESIILSLTDESPDSKLLGVNIDLDYEE